MSPRTRTLRSFLGTFSNQFSFRKESPNLRSADMRLPNQLRPTRSEFLRAKPFVAPERGSRYFMIFSRISRQIPEKSDAFCFSIKFAKTNQKFAENSEFCENYSLLFKISHWCPCPRTTRCSPDPAPSSAARGSAAVGHGLPVVGPPRKPEIAEGCSQ